MPNTYRKRDRETLAKAITLLQKIGGVDFGYLTDDGMDFENAVYQVRDFYETHIADASVPLRDLIKHARRGDLLLKFSDHTRLNEMLTGDVLDKAYRRAIRRKHEELGDGY